jgi:predicted oxidoreductase
MLVERLPGSRTDRFPNLEIIEADDETAYFDALEDDKFLWASSVQVYLELMAGDKRDRETAEQVRSFILKLPAWPTQAAALSGKNGPNPVPRMILTSFCAPSCLSNQKN